MPWSPFEQPLRDPSRFPVPVGWAYEGPGTCRSCGASIAWVSRQDRKMPVDADGKPHQGRCPHRDFHAERARARAAAREAAR